MLNAFRDHLKQLSVEPRDPFTQIVRKLVGPRAAVEYEVPVRRMVLAMPDMIHQIGLWAEEPAQPETTKRLHAFVLRYLYHPSDFLSERNLGFFGYVDDAYIVASVYQKTVEAEDGVGLRPSVEDPAIAASVASWLKTTEKLLPDETARIKAMLKEFKYHNDRGFLWAIQRASKGTTLSRKLEKETYK